MSAEVAIPDPFDEDPFHVPDDFEIEHGTKPKWVYAYQMHLAGVGWSKIADLLGYASANTALTAVTQRRKEMNARTSFEEVVHTELDRLDALQLVAWRTARLGDLKAMDTILKIMDRRAKLLGLDKKPVDTVGGDVVHNTAFFIGGSEDEYVQALTRAREAARKGKVIEGVPEE